MVITFFGHAQIVKSSEIKKALMEILEKQVGDNTAEMLLGGYGDFDELAYTCCKEYKQTHPNVSLLYVTPYLTNASPSVKYDAIIYPEIEDKPLKFAITYRNRWMVDRADAVIAFVNRKQGGAYKTFAYAKRKGKTVINLGIL